MAIQETPQKRGRPRKFDEGAALQAAGNVFWSKGFSATSLDDLGAAMGMNRPSIYGAFGDKESLYRQALAQFALSMETGLQDTLFAKADVQKALLSFYRQALRIYSSGTQPLGCLVMSTAVAPAVTYPDVQADLQGIIQTIDQAMERRLTQAVDQGQLPTEFDCAGRAVIAQSVLHSLSLRARAGEPKSKLNRLIKSGVEVVLC